MQSDKRIFDDLSKFLNGVAGTVASVNAVKISSAPGAVPITPRQESRANQPTLTAMMMVAMTTRTPMADDSP